MSRGDEWPLLPAACQQPVEPDPQAEAGLHRFQSRPLRGRARRRRSVVDGPVTYAP